MKNWAKISTTVPGNIPENLRKIWGGDSGAPILDKQGIHIGWASTDSVQPGQKVEAIDLSGNLYTIQA